jgi:hypothetical protein
MSQLVSATHAHHFTAASEPGSPTTADIDRAARLRQLADWSVTTANLDWDHLDSIDGLGWGADLEE